MKTIVTLRLAALMLLLTAGGICAWSQRFNPDEDKNFQVRERNGQETDIAYRNYFRTDSAYVYRWNITASDWELYQVQHYLYTDGRLTQLLTRNYQTGTDAALSVYVYNSSGRTESSTNYSWAGTWVPSTRYLNEYDFQGRTVSIKLQKWVNGEWAEERLQQNYVYDTENRVIGYETIYWRNNAWTPPTVNVQYYNELGQLENVIATRPGGAIDFRIIYEYNESGLMAQFYTQYPLGDGWSNWNLRSFQYDGCGGRHTQIQYSGEGPNWVPSTKTEFFASFSFDLYNRRKVPVCHNGITIWIAKEAVPAHLRHGDCIGECLEERIRPEAVDRKPPFTVYPNPARERITVSFEDDWNCEGKRIELTDFAGNLIKSYPVRDNAAIIIERGRLRSGQYLLRLVGNEVYSLSVIFE